MQQGRKIVEPAYLKAGDKVAIVSPAYWIPQEAIQLAAAVIRSWGLEPVIGQHTNELNVNAYAGTADQRAADLLWALEDDSIKAIICGRGGTGGRKPVLLCCFGRNEIRYHQQRHHYIYRRVRRTSPQHRPIVLSASFTEELSPRQRSYFRRIHRYKP